MAYHIIDLGALNGDFSHGIAVNNCGQVVGWTGSEHSPGNTASHGPFVWEQGKMDLLPLATPETGGTPWALNNFQQIVGTGANSISDRAALWDHTAYQRLQFAGDAPAALGINDCGFVVGCTSGPYAGHNYHAYSTQCGQLPFLPTVPPPDDLLLMDRYSRAYAINNRGYVVGSSDMATTLQQVPRKMPFEPPVPEIHACMWYNGVVVSLGSLHAGEGSEAYGINEHLQVVGRSGSHAFLYQNGQMRDLGPGAAFNVNNNGVVVGDTFRWRNGQRKTLQSLLPSTTPWTILQGRDINDDEEIVGTGMLNGKERAFLMWP